MTKDLALLVGPDQKWLTTTGFLEKVDENLQQGARRPEPARDARSGCVGNLQQLADVIAST